MPNYTDLGEDVYLCPIHSQTFTAVLVQNTKGILEAWCPKCLAPNIKPATMSNSACAPIKEFNCTYCKTAVADEVCFGCAASVCEQCMADEMLCPNCIKDHIDKYGDGWDNWGRYCAQ